VRILKGLGSVRTLLGTIEVGWKLDFNAEGTEFAERRERSKEEWEFVELRGERNINHGTGERDNCQ
jgi:hypothetical protein